MLKGISIGGLFGRFNYSVPLHDGAVTVLTGPNGFGKSTLFSLVSAVANRNRKVLLAMPAKEFSLTFDNGEKFVFEKDGDDFIENGETVKKDSDITKAEERVATLLGAVKRVGGDGFTSAALGGEEKIREYAQKLRGIPLLVGSAYNAGEREKEKAELLINLLGEKFTFKTPIVDKDGLEFVEENGEMTPFTALSAGEIRLTEFYTDLFFNTPDGALLLIDEPEISMHIAWQFTLVDDIEEICRTLFGAHAIIATHSPQILGGHRDLQVDLGEQYGK